MKIGIVGAGFVGATAAYALVMRGVGRQIVLVDRNEARARAEADDLLHAVPFAHPLDVVAGGYPDLAGARVVILTAGVGQRPGETRLSLLARNAAVFREVVPAVLEQAPEAVLIVATNPVDVMTHLAARGAAERGVPRSRVLGSGTMLDTARFRTLLGRRLGVDAAHVHAYVVGEHGDSEVLTWSMATVGGLPLADMAAAARRALRRRSEGGDRRGGAGRRLLDHRRQGRDVLRRGQRPRPRSSRPCWATSGRSSPCARRKPRSRGSATSRVSLPRVVGGAGVLETLPLVLPPEEEEALARSAGVVRAAIDGLRP